MSDIWSAQHTKCCRSLSASACRAGTWFPSGIALHFSLLLNFPPHLAHIGLALVTATVTELFRCGVPSKVHPVLGSGGSSLGRSKRFSIVLLGRTTCVGDRGFSHFLPFDSSVESAKLVWTLQNAFPCGAVVWISLLGFSRGHWVRVRCLTVCLSFPLAVLLQCLNPAVPVLGWRKGDLHACSRRCHIPTDSYHNHHQRGEREEREA